MYLEESVLLCGVRPTVQITFRAITRWASVAAAIQAKGPIWIYFAPIGESNQVSYRARLDEVLLEPKLGESRTEELLEKALPATHKEGLWEGKVQTLYVISGCHKLVEPFSMSSLKRLENDETLSDDYGYSYALVHARQGV
jgi:hypothetical protein